jgi:hypothetical protein
MKKLFGVLLLFLLCVAPVSAVGPERMGDTIRVDVYALDAFITVPSLPLQLGYAVVAVPVPFVLNPAALRDGATVYQRIWIQNRGPRPLLYTVEAHGGLALAAPVSGIAAPFYPWAIQVDVGLSTSNPAPNGYIGYITLTLAPRL